MILLRNTNPWRFLAEHSLNLTVFRVQGLRSLYNDAPYCSCKRKCKRSVQNQKKNTSIHYGAF